MIIFSPDNQPMPELSTLEPVVRNAFPDADVVIPARESSLGAPRIRVTPIADPPFSVRGLRNGSVSIDGTLKQDSTVAALVRSLLPDGQRAVAVTPNGSQFVELTPGISPDDVANGWRDIADLDLD